MPGGIIMKKWLLTGLIILILIASGCVGDKTGKDNAGTQQKPEPIKIGVLITYTGALGPIGEGMANGAMLAAQEINKKGINGSNVTLIIEDTGTNPAKAAVAKSRKRLVV